MQGDPNVAAPPPIEASPEIVTYRNLLGAGPAFGLRQMASYAAQRWGVIVWEPAYTYSTGDPDVCLHDVVGAINWLLTRIQEWGGATLPMVYAGHSAGGQLSLRAALSPFVPAPKAWLGMAAAGLTVHNRSDVQDAPGGFGMGGTGWIFLQAWGADATRWPDYAPDTHLADRADRFPLYLEQGNLDGRSDGSVLVRWARDFVPRAQSAGWPVTYHEQSGADHYAVRFDQSAVTRADMDAIWS
jgi:acetyl esterase/lipase